MVRFPRVRRPLAPSHPRVATLLAAAAATLWASGCQPADAGSRPRVLLIGIDGVRPDVLAEVATPNLDALRADGAYTASARTTDPTVSGPGWSSMLIGVWPDKHGVLSNDFTSNRYGEWPDFLTRLESADSTLRTVAVADWPPLVEEDSGGPLIGDAPDVKHHLNGYEIGWGAADSLSTILAVEELRSGDPDALFLYLGNPDETSHQAGSIGEEYRSAIAEADRRVGEVLAALRSRPGYAREDWLILVSTDHGRTPRGGHGGESPEERTIFILAAGPAAAPGEIPGGAAIVDVAVTALTHVLGSVDPAWGLDGKPVGLRER